MSGKVGGNRKKQTFRNCEFCGVEFGPLKHLYLKFCSKKCAYEGIKLRPKKPKLKALTKARSANSLLSYHVKAGNITKPSICESCGKENARIEGAHYNYDEPLNVRWLCKSCHIKWDKAEPKGGYIKREVVNGR